jgi:hypothetical protein
MRRRISARREAFRQFLQKDESLSVLLVLLVLLVFVLPPIAPRDGPGGPITAILFSFVLIVGVATVMRQSPWVVRLVACVCLVALPLRWAAWVEPGADFAIWSAASQTLALAVLAVVVLSMVLRPGSVSRHRIEGAVAAYLLLGLAWAGAYEWVARSLPGAFAGVSAVGGRQWVYYSLVTLTTMGYGDITPVAPVARSLAVAEALTGQLYVAILISRLVALELQGRQKS